MNISIIVVAYNEENNIMDCLQSLIAQNYSIGKYEIIVVDGKSEDHTPEIVKGYCEKYSFIRLIENPKRTISSNRNMGISRAKYSFVAYTDADCICPANWLEQLTDQYKRLCSSGVKIGAVGGGNTADKHFGQVAEGIAIAFDSRLSALGSVQSKLLKHVQRVESLACLNVLYDKEALKEIGMFDEGLKNLGEDWDVNYRLRKKGYSLYYLPTATVLHKMRPTLLSFSKQMYRYGRGRAVLIKKHKFITLRYLTPLLFILFMLFLPLLYVGFGQGLSLLPLSYFPAMMLYAIFLCVRKKRFKMVPLVTWIFIITHFCYSYGELKGLLTRGKGETYGCISHHTKL
jgi:GT2 family glycosyltransferase